MIAPNLKMRVLQRAVQLAGDERQLARHLRVPLPDLILWLKGEEAPPQAVFLKAVDVLSELGGLATLPAPAPEETSAREPAVR